MARPHPALIEIAAGRPTPAVADHDELYASAWEHRMIGLLWSRVRDGDLDAPREWKRRLAQVDLRVRARHTRYRAALVAAVGQLRDMGLDAISLKGVAAEQRWYTRVGERPTSDVDLLLPPGAAVRAEEIIRAFEPDHRWGATAPRLVASGEMNEVEVRHPDGVVFDLHFSLFPIGLRLGKEHVLWDRSEYLAIDGTDVRVLDAETSLVHLLAHLNGDNFARLLWYADIARVLDRTPGLDWDAVARMVSDEGLGTLTSLSLEAVCNDLRLPKPARMSPTPGWRAGLWRRLWAPDRRLQGKIGSGPWERRNFWLPFLQRGHEIEALRWWVRRVFPSRDSVERWHPSRRGPYVWRLVSGRLRRSTAASAESRRVRRNDQWRARSPQQ